MRVFTKIILILASCIIFAIMFSITVFAGKGTLKNDHKPPSTPGNLTYTSVTDTSISLKWDASTDNVGIDNYTIYKNDVYYDISTSTTLELDNLIPNTAYRFYVVAVDGKGNVSNRSNTLTVSTKQDTQPTDTQATDTQATSSKIIGYYAAWSAYSGFTPDKIDANLVTHINYAFANIDDNYKITMGYPDIDISNFSKLNSLKLEHPQLKTLISVGGWSWSGKFSDVALTDTSRTTFAYSVVDFIVKYGFDGVDIDWEYPVSGGLSTNVNRPEDKHNFTLLLQKLREKLDERGLLDNKTYLLTIAGAPGYSYINNTELGIIQQYVDYANLMTYDLHGTWDKYTDFNAALYDNSDLSNQYKLSVDAGVTSWLNTGFPADKLVMGVPFYGYKYNYVNNSNNGLYQTFTGGSAISYNDIVTKYLSAPGYNRYFHSDSMVPWLFNGSTFISYDDEQSITLKAQYTNTKGLAGAAVWELSQDPNKILLNALHKGIFGE